MSIAILIPQISELANALFLGNYSSSDGLLSGKEMLAAAGIAGIYYLVFAMTLYGLVSGMLMLMSRAAGKNDQQKVGDYYATAWVLGFMISCLLIVFSLLFTTAFFSMTVDNAVTERLANEYISVRIWGLPFLFLAQLGIMFFVSTNQTKLMLYCTLGQTLVNILFDYLLINGHSVFPELGIRGAAIASVLAEITFFTIVLLFVFKLKRFRSYQIRLSKGFNLEYMKEALIVSSPLILQFFISIGAWEIFFIFIEHLGQNELASSQILRNVYGMVGIVVWALANTSNSIVSNLYGQQKVDQIIPLVHKVIRISFGYAILVGFFLIMGAKFILPYYTQNKAIIDLSIDAIKIVVLAACIFSVSTIYFNALLGLGKTKLCLLYEIIGISIYLTYCIIFIEINKVPLWAAWMAEFFYWTSMLILSMRYLYSNKWRGLVKA